MLRESSPTRPGLQAPHEEHRIIEGTVVRAVLLRPLPSGEHERLVRLYESFGGGRRID